MGGHNGYRYDRLWPFGVLGGLGRDGPWEQCQCRQAALWLHPPRESAPANRLTQLAHTAARTKRTYRSALSHGIATRRGRTEAMVVVAHAKVTSLFPMLMHQEPYL
jgi:hypothetical protein